MVLQRREKLHLQEIEEILKRENDKNDLLKKEKEQLKLEILLLRNQRNYEELDKKQQLEKLISDLEVTYNKLKQERNAIKGAPELRKQKEHSFANSDMVTSCHFSLSELEQATQNFSDSLKIGEGRCHSCSAIKTRNHLFLNCAFTQQVWFWLGKNSRYNGYLGYFC
jgi:chromosome segregation ATPase